MFLLVDSKKGERITRERIVLSGIPKNIGKIDQRGFSIGFQIFSLNG
jgi:hypothetical protein